MKSKPVKGSDSAAKPMASENPDSLLELSMSSRKKYVAIIRALGAAFVLALASGDQPRAVAADVLPFKATERTLANGLKVIIIPTGFPNLVSVQIPVQTGSRNEVEPGKSGFAHFFEHLMFRGTPSNPPD